MKLGKAKPFNPQPKADYERHEKIMKKLSKSQRKELIAEDEHAASILRWQQIGICGIDAGMLLIHDPCYTLPKDKPEFTYDDCCKCGSKPGGIDAMQLNYLRGHAGAGVVVHSPHGDGTVVVWAKLDAKNRVRAVFLSFDGEIPPTDEPHCNPGTVSVERLSAKTRPTGKTELVAVLKKAVWHLTNGDPVEAVSVLKMGLAKQMDLDTRKRFEKAWEQADIGNAATAETLLGMLIDALCE